MKKYSISDPLLREAIYLGYRGRCFYTGQEVSKEMMEIDHLIPVAKGGWDSIDNYVLTCKNINLAKQDKIEPSMIERMQYIVKIAFVPRVLRRLDELRCKQKKVYRGKKPENLKCVRYKTLFWNGDRGIKILTSSSTVTAENTYDTLKVLDRYLEIAREHSITFCDDAWLTKDFINQIKSLWYEVDNRFIKLVEKAILYDKKSPDLWGTIYFNLKYIDFLEELDAERERLDSHLEGDNDVEYGEWMKFVYEQFPPPEHLRVKWEE